MQGACLLMLASLAAGASLDWDFPSEIGLPANQPYPPMTIALGQGVTFNWQVPHVHTQSTGLVWCNPS